MIIVKNIAGNRILFDNGQMIVETQLPHNGKNVCQVGNQTIDISFDDYLKIFKKVDSKKEISNIVKKEKRGKK